MYNHLLRFHEGNNTLIIVPAVPEGFLPEIRDGFKGALASSDSRSTQLHWTQTPEMDAQQLYALGAELLKDLGRTAIPVNS